MKIKCTICNKHKEEHLPKICKECFSMGIKPTDSPKLIEQLKKNEEERIRKNLQFKVPS